jgi:hypothetical protein
MCLFGRTGLKKQELITESKSRSAIEAARGLSLRERRYLLQAVNSHRDFLRAIRRGFPRQNSDAVHRGSLA